MTIYRADYGVYHPNYDHHVYRNLSIIETDTEPFNRGHDDQSVQYGPLTVDGLTFDGISGYADSVPLIQISDNNPTGTAVSHFRNVRVVNRKDKGRRPLANVGRRDADAAEAPRAACRSTCSTTSGPGATRRWSAPAPATCWATAAPIAPSPR